MSTHSLDCKAYINTGTYGSPTWAEISLARDVSVNRSRAEGDDSSRAYAQASTVVGQESIEISMQAIYVLADTAFAALKSAYEGRDVVEIALMDGPIATVGTKGKRVDVVITAFNRSEAMGDSVKYDITFKGSTKNGHTLADYTVA